MNYEAKGKLHLKEKTVNVTDTFKKREFVLFFADNPTYPETVKFELVQDKCDILDAINLQDEITVHFNLKGRKYQHPTKGDMYFNSLQAWKIDKETNNDLADEIASIEADEATIGTDDLPF
jgi:hypothetical protein